MASSMVAHAMTSSPSQQTMRRSASKSDQLAKAVAESQASPQKSTFRPDSTWSEGGADVVWNGSIPPPLPSPAAYSTHTVFSNTTDDSNYPEFADADEGKFTDGEEASWDGGNTTSTTMSTSDSRKLALQQSSSHSPVYPTPLLKAAPPGRPKRKIVPRPEQSILPSASSDDEEALPDSTEKSHGRTSSIASSIWAGRGGKKVEAEAHPMPSIPPRNVFGMQQQNLSAFADSAKGRQSASSSVYSTQSPVIEWEGSPRLGSVGDDINEGKRRLADGTIVPKMPPMPSRFTGQGDSGLDTVMPRSRSKKGRQNRSPILSYADGAEEEERLEQEREIQEHGGVHGFEVTSSMGPRLKKNSPAPWEMSERDGADGDGQFPRQSTEAYSMSSRPSIDQLMPANLKNSSFWPRQNRNASHGNQSLQSISPPVTAKSSIGSKEMGTIPSSALQDGTMNDAASINRRSRSKSVSNNAVGGVLKGLGLASSGPTPSNKKSSNSGKFGKALRGISSGNRSLSSSSSSGGLEVKKNQGISSEDFAHLPPSPLPDRRFESSVDTRGLTSSESDRRIVSSASRGNLASSDAAVSFPRKNGSGVSPSLTTERQSSSNDSNAGTSVSGTTATSSSHNTALTSPGNQPEKKAADLTELLMASSGKFRDQSFVPSPKKGVKSSNNNLTVRGASSTSNGTPSISSSSSNAHGSEGLTASSSSNMLAGRSDSATPTKALTDAMASTSLSRSRSQGVEPSSTSPSSAVHSVGSLEQVPYKLISLEEARSQHRPQQPRTSSLSGKDATRMDRSASNKSIDNMSEGRNDVQPQPRVLKNKKSGFLRRFAKEKTDNSSEEVRSAVGMSNNQTDSEAGDEISSLRPTATSTTIHSLTAPALSIRPVSSMFNGFAPGMLDPATGEEEKRNDKVQLSTPVFLNNGRLAPQSPAITVYSHDGNSSRTSSQAFYEDAMDHQPFSQNDQQFLKANGRRSDAKKSRNLQPRQSSDSMQSETSSALGLVNGFPPTPTSPMIGFESGGDATTMASTMRAKAVEIEAKIADLLSELVKLRTSAVDKGFASPTIPNFPTEGGGSSMTNSPIHHSTGLGLGQGNSSNVSLQSSGVISPIIPPLSPSMLQTPIASCSNCGCNCADQKRIQTLNEMAILKGMSVLDRGRALKPITGTNTSKFGSYTNR